MKEKQHNEREKKGLKKGKVKRKHENHITSRSIKKKNVTITLSIKAIVWTDKEELGCDPQHCEEKK